MNSFIDTEGLVKLRELAGFVKRSDVPTAAREQLSFEYFEQPRTKGVVARQFTVTVFAQKTNLVVDAGGMWLRGVRLAKAGCTSEVYHDMYVDFTDPRAVKLLGRVPADRQKVSVPRIARLNY